MCICSCRFLFERINNQDGYSRCPCRCASFSFLASPFVMNLSSTLRVKTVRSL
nr:MAG TPA: hypothetical protein [Caudoviricetes sp.]